MHDVELVDSTVPPLLSFDAGGAVVGVGIHMTGRRLIVCTDTGLTLFALGPCASTVGSKPSLADHGSLNMTMLDTLLFDEGATVVAFTSSDDAVAVALRMSKTPAQRTMICYKATRHGLNVMATRSTALPISTLALPDRGERLFVGSLTKDGDANMHCMRDFKQKNATRVGKGSKGVASRIAASAWIPSERHVAAGHDNGTIALINAEEPEGGSCLAKDTDVAISSLHGCSLSTLLAGTAGGEVLVYQLELKPMAMRLLQRLSLSAEETGAPILSVVMHMNELIFAACSLHESERPICLKGSFEPPAPEVRGR